MFFANAQGKFNLKFIKYTHTAEITCITHRLTFTWEKNQNKTGINF